MRFAENPEVIYGAQQLRGKILSRKELGLSGRFVFTRFRLGYDRFLVSCVQGQMSHRFVIYITSRWKSSRVAGSQRPVRSRLKISWCSHLGIPPFAKGAKDWSPLICASFERA